MDKEFEKRMKKQFGKDTRVLKDDNDTFEFSCYACGKCCKNRTGKDSIIVSAYDFYKLRKYYNLSIDDLMENHIDYSIGSNSGLIILYLKNHKDAFGNNVCTFLRKFCSSYKCIVNDNKPTICALYPLGRVAQLNMSDEDEKPRLSYIFTGECNNKNKPNSKTHTIGDWVKDREKEEEIFITVSEFTSKALKYINLKNFFDSDLIDEKSKELIHNLIFTLMYFEYDLDKEFLPQYIENTDTLLEILRCFVTIKINTDESIKGTLPLEEVGVSDDKLIKTLYKLANIKK